RALPLLGVARLRAVGAPLTGLPAVTLLVGSVAHDRPVRVVSLTRPVGALPVVRRPRRLRLVPWIRWLSGAHRVTSLRVGMSHISGTCWLAQRSGPRDQPSPLPPSPRESAPAAPGGTVPAAAVPAEPAPGEPAPVDAEPDASGGGSRCSNILVLPSVLGLPCYRSRNSATPSS